jgi:hypothetical protein
MWWRAGQKVKAVCVPAEWVYRRSKQRVVFTCDELFWI